MVPWKRWHIPVAAGKMLQPSNCDRCLWRWWSGLQHVAGSGAATNTILGQCHPTNMLLNHGNLQVSVGKFNIFETYQHLRHTCPLWLWSSSFGGETLLVNYLFEVMAMWHHIRIQYTRTMLYNSCGRWWPFEYDLAFRMMRPIHSTSW